MVVKKEIKPTMLKSDYSAHSLKNNITDISIVVVIPCLNTAKSIASVINGAKKHAPEVIVVDDGSSDNTAEIAEVAGAQVIKHERNRGKGAAMKTAAERCNADILVFIDGDGQHNPEDIPGLIEPILQAGADFVIGSRYLSESKTSYTPFTRKASNYCASLIISIFISILQPSVSFIKGKRTANKRQNMEITPTGAVKYRLLYDGFKRISDCTSGFTAMKRQNWSKLNLVSNGFQIETEMIFEQAKNGFLIAETPISCKWGESTSKMSIARDGLKTLFLLIKKLSD